MSQMQKFDEISTQIASIDVAQKAMADTKIALRKFVVPDRDEKGKMKASRFLDDYDIFNQLLSKWADTLMTLVEATGTRFAFESGSGFGQSNGFGVETSQSTEGMISRVEQADLTMTKAAVLAVGILGSVLVSYLMKAPWTVPAIMISVIIGLVFFKQIADTIRDLMKKPEKLCDETNSLGDVISDTLIFIRSRYNKKRFQIKHQYSNPKMLANHDPQEDPALWDRRTQALETLPFEVMGRVDAISVKCNAAAFVRKTVLYSYWRDSGGSVPQPQQTAPMGQR
jgi:hypothetical protein